jgi:hypothetical protein
MMTGVTEDHAQDAGGAGHGRHGQPPNARSIMQQIHQIHVRHRHIGDLMANEGEQIQRLKDDVSGYVSSMRDKVTSLQSQLEAAQGQVSSAAADQMARDAQDLSDTLDTLEGAFAQDNPPSDPGTGGGATPTDPGTGDPTDPNAPPAARRR